MSEVVDGLDNKLHERIKLLRKKKGMTMKTLAEEVGTSQQQIDRLEKGRRRLTIEWIEKLSAALDCELADLLPNSFALRDGAKSSRAKVVGSISSCGAINWFGAGESYCIIFGKPNKVSSSCLMALVLEDCFDDYQKGDELIFSEIHNFNENKIEYGRIIICANNSDPDSGDNNLYITTMPPKNSKDRTKGVLIKSIVNE